MKDVQWAPQEKCLCRVNERDENECEECGIMHDNTRDEGDRLLV